MILVWLLVYFMAHSHPPDHTALVIQHWENAHVLLTILILLVTA